MNTTRESLTSKLKELQAERDAFYAPLVSLARTGGDRRVRWKDVDIAQWLGASIDTVRAKIVTDPDLSDFLVDDACTVALLANTEVVVIMDVQTPRGSALNYVLAEISALDKYLAELSE